MDEQKTTKTVADETLSPLAEGIMNEFDRSSTAGVAGNIGAGAFNVSKTMTQLSPRSLYVVERNAFNQLIEENVRLRHEISSLVGKLSDLVALIQEDYSPKAESLIVLREVPRREAKKEILQLFRECGPLYYSDIAERLRLDLELIVDLCSELEKERKIKLAE